MRSALFVAVAVVVAAGCRVESMAAEADDVRVEAAEDHLVVTNGRDERIYYFALFEEAGIDVDWVPCTLAVCAALPPQSITRVPYSEVAGVDGDTILFYWWLAVQDEAAPSSPGPVHVLRVER